MQELDDNIQEGRRYTDEDGVYHRHNNWGGRYREIRQELAETIGFEDFDQVNILDLGTSKGKAVNTMVEKLGKDYDADFNAYAVDVSPEHAQQASRQEHVEHAATARIEEIPFADDSLEAVVCNGLMPYLEQDPEELEAYDENPHYLAYSEINRILSDKGAAAVETVNRLPYEQQFIFEGEDLEQLLERNSPERKVVFDSADPVKFYP